MALSAIAANHSTLLWILASPQCALTFFFFNDTATTEIYTLSLHDALPISTRLKRSRSRNRIENDARAASLDAISASRDRKSTRLNSSHANISYAVFCLKKKNQDGNRRIAVDHEPHVE